MKDGFIYSMCVYNY